MDQHLGLIVDKPDQHFNEALELSGNAVRRLLGRLTKQPKRERHDHNGEEQRVVIDYREIYNRALVSRR